ncbi:MAG: penicillin-binding protein 1C [Bacteroidota bacterium]
MFKRHSFVFPFAALCVIVFAFIGSLFVPLPKDDFSHQSVQSLRIEDRNGIILREFLNDEHGRGEWKPLSSIAVPLQQATIAIEDRRFYSHPGVDPLAIVRSIVTDISALRFKSGGSTLSQQVVRNVYHHPRTLYYKAIEIWYALRIERMFSKAEILEQYLNRAPYGNQLFGAEAASHWYFGKPVSELSIAEAAFLAALPNEPTVLNPNKNISSTINRQRSVLRRMLEQRMITNEEYDRAMMQPVQVIPPEAHFKAPHVAEMVQAMNPATENGVVRTTIDYPLQEQVQWLMRGHLKKLGEKNVHNAAVVVIENRTGEIRALVGSAEFLDTLHQGQVNGATARRQPGSALKPFMYALALEQGYTPATLLADVPTAIPDHHGDYVPENYDRRFHGPVRLRTALACSYNVPAVRTLQMVGKSALLQKLKDVGCTTLDKDAEFYGYGLTLGNAEVTLLDLTTAYMSLAMGGVWKPSTLLPHDSLRQPVHRVYDETAVYLITDILKDNAARRPAFGGNFHFPFQCAVKTGTTKDYKDNWTFGYTMRYTVGVWVGNFDGEKMRRVSGVSGAGPIFSDVMTYLHTAPYGQPPENFIIPDHLVKRRVCARSGELPTQFCRKTIEEWFIEGKTPSTPCTVHRQYVIPGDDEKAGRHLYEVFPPEYSLWSVNEGLPAPPPSARLDSGTPTAHDEHGKHLMIVSPNSGDYFKLDPVLRREFQIITIAGFIPSSVTRVTLMVNGKEECSFDERGVEWKLRKGIFRFQLWGYAEKKKIVSSPVIINVE